MDLAIIGRVIQEVLLAHGVAVLPGLGTLQLAYQPARLARVESRIYPPTRRPVFTADETAVDPDQQVAAALAAREGLQVADAIDVLKAELAAIHEACHNGRQIELPEVGRFFQDEQLAVDFVPAGFNYHLAVYGMSPVPARPIVRRTAAAAAEAAIAAREGRPRPTQTRARRRTDRWFLPITASVLLVALAGCLWLIFKPNPMEEPPVAVTDKGPDNPSVVGLDQEAGMDVLSDTTPLEPEEVFDPEEPEMQGEPTISQTLANEPAATDYIEAQIIVGHFGDPANVAATQERLTELGLTVRTRATDRGLTRVWVAFDPREIDPSVLLDQIRQDFDQSAWLIMPK